jgi:hypothetical protein
LSHFGGGVAERKGYGAFFISARATWRIEKKETVLEILVLKKKGLTPRAREEF